MKNTCQIPHLQAKSLGLITRKEVEDLFAVSDRALRRAIKLGHLYYYEIEGYKRRFFAKKDIKEWLDFKKAKPRVVQLKSKCIHCNKKFSYQKTLKCTGFHFQDIESGLKKPKLRIHCRECPTPSKLKHSEKNKKIIGEKTKAWWNGISHQKKTAIRKKMSTKKQEFWDNNPEQKKRLGKFIRFAWRDYYKEKSLR